MIIRNERSAKTARLRILLFLGIVLLLLAGLYYGYRKFRNHWREGTLVACDMETVHDDGKRKFFRAGEFLLDNGQTQTTEIALSGKHSCIVSEKDPFGTTWETTDVHPGDVFEATVWRNSRDHVGFLIVDCSWGFYKEVPASGKEQKGGWEQLTIRFTVPAYVTDGKLKLYVWNPGAVPAYFDDFAVIRYRADHRYKFSNLDPSDSVTTLNLLISENGMKELQQTRDAAMQKGILQMGKESWIKMKMKDGKKEYPGRLRLKGDWTDHLLGDKWSFRIALDAGFAWRRMVTFSIQNPNTRSFLSEWMYHQWLDKEDVLTPRYGFVEVKINDVSHGLYAYEEHFEKQIVEYNSRREGPILKFDEEGLWEAQAISLENNLETYEAHVPVYQSSNIIPFGVKAAVEDTAMRRQVEIAQQLIAQYKNGQKTIWDIFDPKKVARYYAIIDITGAQHGFIWHNQRWYYNPVISKMEPIGFDGFTEVGPYQWIDKPFIGYARNIRYMSAGYREFMFERFFHDPKFLDLYVGALRKFTNPDYLDQLYLDLAPQIEHYEGWIRREWPDYMFDRKAFFERAKTIRLMLMPMKRTSVKAHTQGKTPKGWYYRLYNYHCLPAILLGVGKKENKMDAPFSEDLVLDAYNNEFPAEYIDAYSTAEGKWVFFKIPGIDSTFSTEILPWEEPAGLTPEQSLFKDLKIVRNEFYQVDDSLKRVTFKRGNYKSSKDLLFPKGYQIWFEKGVTLDLTNKAKFISKSQVLMFGTEEEPILITSSDKSANGFTVLQADGKSEFHYAAFDNLNTLHYQGWNLTGAVTLYESEIFFDHCRFVNNHCEDALNTIRCLFTYSDSYIGYTFGDGFDSDFCTGTLNNALFSHTGNDGMDFSGSKITVNSATVENAGDKGISLGEESTVTIVKATVRNCIIGIAAKDLTKATVKYIELFNNEQGFAAYQKKPEYGPGSFVVEKYKAEGNKQLYVLQAGSTLDLAGEHIEGKR